MIPFRVEADALLRHEVKLVFKRLEVGRPPYLNAFGRAESEITKAEIVRHELPEFQKKRWGVFEQEGSSDRLRVFLIFGRC